MAHAPQFLKLVNDAKKKIKETNVADVKRRADAGEKFVLVDVREDNEWAKGHLPGAVHLGKGVIERDIEQRVPDTSTKLILYCGGGFRSALVADNLQKMGYNNVESMDGGLEGLAAGGSANCERLASNLSSFPNEIGWGGRIRELTSAPAKPSKTEANQG